MEDGDSGDCEHPHSSPDGTGHYQLHGPRPNRILNRKHTTLNVRNLPQEVADLFCPFATLPLCHIKHYFILNFPKKELNMNLDWNIITIFAQN